MFVADEARDGALLDRVMIMDLASRYAWLLDYGRGRAGELAELFTEDGVFELPVQGQRHEGRSAIRTLVERAHGARRYLHHMAANHVIDVSGDEAIGHLHFNEFVLVAGELRNYSQGRYQDEYARTANGWRFRRRQVHIPEESFALMTSTEMQKAGVAIVQTFSDLA